MIDPRSNEEHVSTDELFRVYASFVARLLSRMGVRNDALDDAVQEVFLAAHKNGGYAPGAAKPSTYLARLAFHTALGERRRARRQWARHSERVPEELASCALDPARLVETHQAFGDVDRALGKLSPTLRATLWLADAEGESCVSIAAASEVPVGTVYWRLDRARKQFRDALRRIDAQRAPRRALGIFVLSWRREAKGSEFAAPDVQQLLTSVRSVAASRYDAARGLVRLHATLASGGAAEVAEVAVVSTIAASKGVAALSAACVAVVAGFTVPHFIAPREGQVAVAAPRAVQNAPSSSREAASVTSASPDMIFDSAEASAALSTQPRASESRVDLRGARRSSRRSTEATRGADSSAGTVSAPSPAAQPTSDATKPEEAVRSADAVVAPERQPSPSEIAQVAHAARLLGGQPREALAAVRALPKGTDGAYLLEEREYIEVMALLALGERREATRLAHAFLRRYPSSAFSRTIRKRTASRS